jgi:hypothetical protein
MPRALSICFMLLGGAAIYFGLWTVYYGYASASWPTAPGRVLSARASSSTSDKKTSYSASVKYEFTVGDAQHPGWRVSYRSHATSYEYVQDVLARFPVGQEISVHYEPGNPQRSVLEPGQDMMCLMGPGIGAVFFFVGLWLFRHSGTTRVPPEDEPDAASEPNLPGVTVQ